VTFQTAQPSTAFRRLTIPMFSPFRRASLAS
jgi:hypothetical protein